MAEMHHGGRSATANLGLRALLYASDALDASEAAAFEHSLAGDQQCREALAEAVAYLQRWDPNLPRQPDPSYRERVRQSLADSGLPWQHRKRGYRGHPLLWSTLGALAAGLLIALGLRLTQFEPSPTAEAAPENVQPQQIAHGQQPDDAEFDVLSDEELALWADLPRSRHLLKVHHEESERKRRSELHMRVVLRSGIGPQQSIAKGDSPN